MVVKRIVISVLAMFLLPTLNVFGQENEDFRALSLEELLDVPVFSAAKQVVPMSKTAGAAYVITADDIRRFGFRNVPEALRMVPGVSVASIDAVSYAVSIRGFTSRFSNKLLVLIDGRSIYTPLFSGVMWELSVPMSEIDRIEVIRGPGSTLWGANAVNGVINIITRSAAASAGHLVEVRTGSFADVDARARHAVVPDDGPAFKVYGQYQHMQAAETAGEEELHDGGRMGVGGARVEWKGADFDSRLEVIGQKTTAGYIDTYVGSLEPPYKFVAEENSTLESLIMVYSAESADEGGDGFSFSAHGELSRVDSPAAGAEVKRFGFDATRRIAAGRHAFLFGGGYRLDEIDYQQTFAISTTVEEAQDWRLDCFVQDAFDVVPERLQLTLGIKAEYGTAFDLGLQPNVRALWTPHERHAVWTSVARSLRSPNVTNRDFLVTGAVVPPDELYPGSPLTRTRIVGSSDHVSERLLANELGYRHMPTSWFAIDAAAFYNVYDRLSTLKRPTLEFVAEDGPPHARIDYATGNGASGKTWGGELALDLRPAPWWRVRASWSLFRAQQDPLDLTVDAAARARMEASPENQVNAWSSFDIGADVGFDAAWRYVDGISELKAPGYSELDLRLRWRLTHALEISIAGRNLLHEKHSEPYANELISRQWAYIPRYCTAGLRWGF